MVGNSLGWLGGQLACEIRYANYAIRLSYLLSRIFPYFFAFLFYFLVSHYSLFLLIIPHFSLLPYFLIIVTAPGIRWLRMVNGRQRAQMVARKAVGSCINGRNLVYGKLVGCYLRRGRPPNAGYHMPQKNDNPSQPQPLHSLAIESS
jgi:hypothetical protein